MQKHVETNVGMSDEEFATKVKEAQASNLRPYAAFPNKSKFWAGGKIVVWADTAYETKQLILEAVKPNKKDVYLCSPLRLDLPVHANDF